MQFSDTSTKQGLLQDCEFWTNLGDAVITGNALLKAQFTRLLNVRNAAVQAELQMLTGVDGAEDTNYTSQQFSLFDIVSGQNDYQFTVDEAGNTISDITGVSILTSSTATEFQPLDRLTLDAAGAQLIMSPNPASIGVPSGYIEKNNIVYFDVKPTYNATQGGKLFYRLVPSYFVAGDTTKKPGFAEGFHRILSMGASLDWLEVNMPANGVLIGAVTARLQKLETGLKAYTRQRNPTRARIVSARRSAK